MGAAVHTAICLGEKRHIGHAECADGFAVVAASETNEFLFLRMPRIAPGMKTHLQRNLYSRRAIRRIKAMTQNAVGLCSESFRQLHHRRMREARQHRMLELFELIVKRGINARVRMTKQINPP